MSKFTVSRRGLLSAGVAASAASLASSVFAQEKKSSLVPDKWDLTTEVLVVGFRPVQVLQPPFLQHRLVQRLP